MILEGGSAAEAGSAKVAVAGAVRYNGGGADSQAVVEGGWAVSGWGRCSLRR